MPGNAKTSSLLLSTATVMVGPAPLLHQLNPDDHSVGLVKNFQLTADPQYVELTQNVRNNVVMSVKNSDGLKAAMEVYEYTPKNITYAAGLDGHAVASQGAIYQISEAATVNTVKLVGDVSVDIVVGHFLFLQRGSDDLTHIAKVAGVAVAGGISTITIAAGFEIPASLVFSARDRAGRVRRTQIGDDQPQAELAAKIVGVLPKDGSPFTILLPRIRITKGLSIGFQSENFASLPFEFSVLSGTPGDPSYAEFGSAAAILMAPKTLGTPPSANSDQGAVPTNAVLLNGQPIMLNGQYILLTKAA